MNPLTSRVIFKPTILFLPLSLSLMVSIPLSFSPFFFSLKANLCGGSEKAHQHTDEEQKSVNPIRSALFISAHVFEREKYIPYKGTEFQVHYRRVYWYRQLIFITT